MKYLKKYKIFESIDEQKIHVLCKKYGISNYTINEDGSIDVDGGVILYNKGLTKIPIHFRNVSGDFYCNNNNKLMSLEGAPDEVGGDFYCYNNQLTSLKGAPIQVGGGFYCYNNNLTSLEGAPDEVGGYFYCNDNKLTSLKGAPSSVGGNFYCNHNKLTSLEGAPTSVGGNFMCYNNNLTSLEGAPTSVGGSFYCYNNQLTSLKGASSQVGGYFDCSDNNLTSLDGLEWKSFRSINLVNNPVYEIVKDWINHEDREDLIEYFIDMNVIQEGDDKPKLILPRLEAFHEEMDIKMDIDFEEVKKYYEIIK